MLHPSRTLKFCPDVNPSESVYIEKSGYLSRLAHEEELAFRESDGHLVTEFGSEAEWLRCVREDFPKFLPLLAGRCHLRFHGRVLEIGAGAAWFSAELSKLPDVREVIATDFSPQLLKEHAPCIFAMLGADGSKITRMPADFHALDFPAGHFDFVVCSAVLHHAVDMVRLLREARRVLKPGGAFVAIREPVWPLVRLQVALQDAAEARGRRRERAFLHPQGVSEILHRRRVHARNGARESRQRFEIPVQ